MSRQIGIALSGGGHRATAFAVGVLLYLRTAELRGDVASIASVSGGSLANAGLAARLDFTSAPDDDVDGTLRHIARRCTGRWLTLSGSARLFALTVIGVWAGLALVGVWFLPVDLELQAVALVVGVVILLGLVGFVVTGRGSLFGWWGTWAYLGLLLLLAELVAVGVPRLRHGQALRDAFDLVGVGGWADSVVTVIVLVAIGLLLVAALLSLRGSGPREARRGRGGVGDDRGGERGGADDALRTRQRRRVADGGALRTSGIEGGEIEARGGRVLS